MVKNHFFEIRKLKLKLGDLRLIVKYQSHYTFQVFGDDLNAKSETHD